MEHMTRCIALDIDCAALCQLTAATLTRNGPMVAALCAACAQTCAACADECGRHEALHCLACAEACRRCAELCRSIAVS